VALTFLNGILTHLGAKRPHALAAAAALQNCATAGAPSHAEVLDFGVQFSE